MVLSKWVNLCRYTAATDAVIDALAGCLNNMARCHLRLHSKGGGSAAAAACVAAATAALSLRRSAVAFYLRGRARTALNQFRLAGEDLKAALALQKPLTSLTRAIAAAGEEEDEDEDTNEVKRRATAAEDEMYGCMKGDDDDDAEEEDEDGKETDTGVLVIVDAADSSPGAAARGGMTGAEREVGLYKLNSVACKRLLSTLEPGKYSPGFKLCFPMQRVPLQRGARRTAPPEGSCEGARRRGPPPGPGAHGPHARRRG
jgi:hypothetical protein